MSITARNPTPQKEGMGFFFALTRERIQSQNRLNPFLPEAQQKPKNSFLNQDPIIRNQIAFFL